MSDAILIDCVSPATLMIVSGGVDAIMIGIDAPIVADGLSLTPSPLVTSKTIDLRSRKLPAGVTIKRASVGSRITADALVAFEPIDTPRWDYDPSSARTNYVRNSEFVGWIPGSPGTMPGGSWSASGTGIVRQLVEVGTDADGRYAIIRISGTNTATAIAYPHLKLSNAIACSAGEVWGASVFVEVLSGDWASIGGYNPFFQVSGAAGLISQPGRASATPLTTFSTAMPVGALTFDFGLRMVVQVGATIDTTIRIRRPQVERGATLTAYIPTTGTIRRVASFMGLLIEPSKANYATASNGPVLSRVTRTLGIDDPAGGTDAARYVVANPNNDPIASLTVNTPPSGRTFTRSLYVRNALMNGQASSANLFDYGSSGTESVGVATITTTPLWVRYSATRTYPAAMTSTSINMRLDPFDGTAGTNAPIVGSSMDSAFWQYEEGTVATSYILPTQTRAADVLTIDWAQRGIRDGVTTIRYTFDDETTQDVATTIMGGKSVVPTNLRRSRLRQIAPVG